MTVIQDIWAGFVNNTIASVIIFLVIFLIVMVWFLSKGRKNVH